MLDYGMAEPAAEQSSDARDASPAVIQEPAKDPDPAIINGLAYMYVSVLKKVYNFNPNTEQTLAPWILPFASAMLPKVNSAGDALINFLMERLFRGEDPLPSTGATEEESFSKVMQAVTRTLERVTDQPFPAAVEPEQQQKVEVKKDDVQAWSPRFRASESSGEFRQAVKVQEQEREVNTNKTIPSPR